MSNWDKVNKKNLGKLIAALRNPENKQVDSVLRAEIDEKGKFGYCCLGLACKISRVGKFVDNTASFVDNKPYSEDDDWRDKNKSYLTYRVQKWLGVDTSDPYIELPRDAVKNSKSGSFYHVLPTEVSMTQMNDTWHLTFPQIADMLEYFIYNNLPDDTVEA